MENQPIDPQVALNQAFQAGKQAGVQETRLAVANENRISQIQAQLPNIWARITILLQLSELQQQRGGQFEKGFTFVHMPQFVLNIRRIGMINIQALNVCLEVYDHDLIKQGIAWVPLDQILWAGSVDQEFGKDKEHIGLSSRKDVEANSDSIREDMRKLTGFPPLAPLTQKI